MTKAKKAKNSDADKKPKKSQKTQKNQPFIVKLFYLCLYSGLGLAIVTVFGLWLYAMELNRRYQLDDEAMGGALWELPSRVYARPLELYVGKPLNLALGYQRTATALAANSGR